MIYSGQKLILYPDVDIILDLPSTIFIQPINPKVIADEIINASCGVLNIVGGSNYTLLGNGTESNPYRISDAIVLTYIPNESSAYYVLDEDIDCSGIEIGMIG